jgi:hypothetical protein
MTTTALVSLQGASEAGRFHTPVRRGPTPRPASISQSPTKAEHAPSGQAPAPRPPEEKSGHSLLGSGIGVREHPQGGYTLAVPVPGAVTARVYLGRFPSIGAAAHHAVSTPVAELEAQAAALAAARRIQP